MSIPLNGRIAIIDNNIDQALPLMQLFSRMQLPYVFYKGYDLSYLPEEGKAQNDIRLLFLDINLIDEGSPSDKQITSVLYSVLKRIIPEQNYPYLLIYWSRTDDIHGKLVRELFSKQLKNRAPINFLSLNKSEYFELTNEKTHLHDEKIPELFTKIQNAISQSPIYNNLMAWENLIHNAADATLNEVFQNSTDAWQDHSSLLFTKLAVSFSGANYKSMEVQDKVRSGFYSLNYVFTDSLEHSIGSYECDLEAQNILSNSGLNETVYSINRKLLFASERTEKCSPGIVSHANATEHNFNVLLHSAINRHYLLQEKGDQIISQLEGVADEQIKKRREKIEKAVLDDLKTEITSTALKVEINVTPLCDYVQGKEEYTRLLPGFLIESKFRNYIDVRTEALFLSPAFALDFSNDADINQQGIYFMLLDFRFLHSIKKSKLKDYINPIMRMRQQLLSEVQSKLARHINRQGVLFLE